MEKDHIDFTASIRLFASQKVIGLEKYHEGVNPKIGGFYPPKMDGDNFQWNTLWTNI